MTLTVDDIFESIGSFGRFQIFLTFLCGLISVLPPFQLLIGSFIAAEPGWKCTRTNDSQCNISGIITSNDPKDTYNLRCHIPRKDWEFSTPYEYTSVITKWDLVCDKAILGTFATSLVLIGVLPGNLLFGALGDRYGRRNLLFIAVYVCSFAAAGSALVPDFWMFGALRFIAGVGVGGTLLLGIVLPMEFVGVRHRGTAGMGVQISWSLALMVLALAAYFLRHWWELDLVISVVGFPMGLLWICVPESPRWYLLHGKVDKCRRVLNRVANVNGKEMPPGELSLPAGENGDARSQNILDLFRTWKLARQMLILWVLWFANAAVYYGVALSAGTLGGNMYLDFFLSSAIELPAVFAGMAVMNKFGRKSLAVGGLILASLSSAACALGFPPEKTSPGMTAGRIITALLAKFFIMPAFAGGYVFSAELLPTSLRNIGVGSCSAVGRVGSFAAPYILFLGEYWNVPPYGLMAILALMAGLLGLTLTETHMQPTKEVLNNEDKPKSSRSGEEEEPMINDDHGSPDGDAQVQVK